jgi:hypothetical protein
MSNMENTPNGYEKSQFLETITQLSESFSTDNLDRAIWEVSQNATRVVQDAENTHFHNAYSTIGAILLHLKPLLHESDLSMSQHRGNGSWDAKVFTLTTTIRWHPPVNWVGCAPEHREYTFMFRVKDEKDPQAVQSGYTYYRRGQLMDIFGLVPSAQEDMPDLEEGVDVGDDDANVASGKSRKPKQTPLDKKGT